MQVRTVEFQENFRLVTLEASRQLSVLNRDAIDIAQKAAETLAEQRLQDLGRLSPETESESTGVVKEGQGNGAGRRRNRSENEGEDPENGGSPERGLPQGKVIDLFA